MDTPVTQMRKGVLEYCVIALLIERPWYGYELVQELSAVDGMLTTEGTIYPLLSRLRREGLVQTEWRESTGGPPRKYYRVTEDGQRALDGFKREWRSFSEAIDHFIKRGVTQ